MMHNRASNLNFFVLIAVMASAVFFCAADRNLQSIHATLNRLKGKSQHEYRVAIIEYGKYFQNIAKNLGSLYLHPFDLAQFFVKIENVFKDMDNLQQLKGTLSAREDLIRCIANEIFLYDTWDANKQIQVACAVHLLHEGKKSDEYLEVLPMKNIVNLRSQDLVQTMNLSKTVYHMFNLDLCFKLGPAISDVEITETSFDAILNRTVELEKANLQATFSTPTHMVGDERENAEFASGIKQILSRAETDMQQATQALLPLSKNYRKQKDAATSYSEVANAQVNFERRCDPYNAKFNGPRGELEDLFAKHFVYRPIKVTDFQTDGIFLLQDIAYEYVTEVKRQFGELRRYENDKTELITLFYEKVPTFWDEEMKQFRKSITATGLQIFAENINIFAMQRFQFYRDVQLSGVPQPLLNGGQPPFEKYFLAAINLLEKKRDKQFPFKLLGSHKMSDFIAIIKANKSKHTGERTTEAAYHTLYEQIIFANYVIDAPKNCFISDDGTKVDYPQLFKARLEEFGKTLRTQVSASTYLKTADADQLLSDLREQTQEFNVDFRAFVTSKSHAKSAIIAKALCDKLEAAQTDLIKMLLTNGVYVPVRINNNYPWARVVPLFADTNYDAVKGDFLHQAEERAKIAANALPESILGENATFLTGMKEVWPRESIDHLNAAHFPSYEAFANVEILKNFDALKMRMRAFKSSQKLAASILADRSSNKITHDIIEKHLNESFKRVEDQLVSLKQKSIEKIADSKIRQVADTEITSYSTKVMQDIRELALIIFTEFTRNHDPTSPSTESALIACCTRFFGIFSRDLLRMFMHDIHRYRMNNQTTKKMPNLPRSFIPIVAPVLMAKTTPSEGTIKSLKALATIRLKLILLNTLPLGQLKQNSSVSKIDSMQLQDNTQNGLDQFVAEINKIASVTVDEYLMKADAELRATYSP